MKQSQAAKKAEIDYRRDYFWSAGENAEYFRGILNERRSFLTTAAMNGALRSPVLEIGAEYAFNGMILQNELGMDVANVDLSPDALRAATVVSRILGYDAPVHRVAADAERLPYANGSFNSVLLWGTLHHFADPSYLLDEIWRVLAPDGHIVIAEEPIRRRLQWARGRTTRADHLTGWRRLLANMHLLPFFARIGGAEEEAAGVTERDFFRHTWEGMFARYIDAKWFYQPQLTGGMPSAGPLGRTMWRWFVEPERRLASLTEWFGGAVNGWAKKPAAVRSLGRARYLLRKHPRHDRIRIQGYNGALICQGETMVVEYEVGPLPASAKGRASVTIELPREPRRVDFFSDDHTLGLVSYTLTEEFRQPAAVRLACPDCVVFTEKCIFGACRSECVQACPRDALAPTNPRLPVKVSCDGCGLCLHACPYGGLDRPLVVEERCPECRRRYTREQDVIESRPKELVGPSGTSHWEKMLR
ncbi:MAG TPA: methyltransferase domain-containing protein [bacterium]|nr:methyltransferase domain-containing protein [bacterium]